MTEATPAYDPAGAWAQIEAQHAARNRLAEDALPAVAAQTPEAAALVSASARLDQAKFQLLRR